MCVCAVHRKYVVAGDDVDEQASIGALCDFVLLGKLSPRPPSPPSKGESRVRSFKHSFKVNPTATPPTTGNPGGGQHRLLDFSFDVPTDTNETMLLKRNDDALQLEQHAGGVEKAKRRGNGVVNAALKSDWIAWLPGLVSFASRATLHTSLSRPILIRYSLTCMLLYTMSTGRSHLHQRFTEWGGHWDLRSLHHHLRRCSCFHDQRTAECGAAVGHRQRLGAPGGQVSVPVCDIARPLGSVHRDPLRKAPPRAEAVYAHQHLRHIHWCASGHSCARFLCR